MSPAEGYVALFSLAAGAGIAGFWTVVLALGKVDALGDFGVSRPWHIAAEFITAAFLIAGGIGLFADPDAPWARALAGVGVGALVYAVAQSPGYYLRKASVIAAVIALAGAGALVAIALLLVTG